MFTVLSTLWNEQLSRDDLLKDWMSMCGSGVIVQSLVKQQLIGEHRKCGAYKGMWKETRNVRLPLNYSCWLIQWQCTYMYVHFSSSVSSLIEKASWSSTNLYNKNRRRSVCKFRLQLELVLRLYTLSSGWWSHSQTASSPSESGYLYCHVCVVSIRLRIITVDM